MCFSKEMSLSFAMVGLAMSVWVWYRMKNLHLAAGVFFFFLMEFLQFFQYLTIDDCENETNRILTVLGFAHICLQPYFTHVLNAAVTRSPKLLTMWVVVLRLCLVGGAMLFGRFLLTQYTDLPRQHFSEEVKSTEWLRGEDICTFRGKHHLAWSIPMADATYYVPGAAIHSFLMFVPFFCIKPQMIVLGIFLWATGPYLAAQVTDNLMEQASVWCFFSIAQIGIMLYVVRDMLVVSNKQQEDDAESRPYIVLKYIWPMGVVVPPRNDKSGAISKKKK